MLVDGTMLNRLLKLFGRKGLEAKVETPAPVSSGETDIIETERLAARGIGDSADLGEPDHGDSEDSLNTDTYFGLHADPITGEILAQGEAPTRKARIAAIEDSDDFSDMLEIDALS